MLQNPPKSEILNGLYINNRSFITVREDYLRQAQQLIQDPNILVNVVSRRVKQLRNGRKPLIESLETLSPEDIALREIIEHKITWTLYSGENK